MKRIYLFHSYKLDTLDKLTDLARGLEQENVAIVSIDQWLAAPMEADVAALTFDDGFEPLYPKIGQFLRSRGLRALAFVIPLSYDMTRMRFQSDYWLENEDVFELGSHSLTHSKVYSLDGSFKCDEINMKVLTGYRNAEPLDKMDISLLSREWLPLLNREETHEEYVSRVRSELWLTKNIIERSTGKPCRFFAYPWGRYNNHLRQIVIDIGHEAAFSVKKTDGDEWSLPRIQLN